MDTLCNIYNKEYEEEKQDELKSFFIYSTNSFQFIYIFLEIVKEEFFHLLLMFNDHFLNRIPFPA